MANIPELEERWRAAARAQAEAKKAFDDTVRQLGLSKTGAATAVDPAVRLAAGNLSTATQEWRKALDDLLAAVEALNGE